MATYRARSAAARDGFVTYDELGGPDLDAARWSPARLPLPTGGDHIPLDPHAELAVGEGEVRVTIPRFSLSHDTFQPADSAKYLVFSTGQFELPTDRPATFAADLAVKNIGAEPGDYRRGMAAFHVFDFDVSKRDRSSSTAAWRVDGRTVYEAHGTLIPERVRIGFGIWTMLPIRDGRSRSLDGQGIDARWRRFRVKEVRP
jgi:hypothetical protein